MNNVVTDQNDIEGMMVSFDAKIPMNSYFFQESLIAPEEMPDSLFSNIPDGYTIFALQIDNIAVKDGNGNNVFRDRDNIGAPEVLLFAVPEDLYLLLSKAIYVGMEIVPVPRNSSYSTNPGETLVESEFLKNFILAKTVQIPDENIEG